MNTRALFSLALLCSAPAVSLAERPTAEQLEFFENKIRPVLVKHCYECHSAKLEDPKGGLRLDTRQALLDGGDSGAAIDLEDVEQSLLLNAIRYEDMEMPPKGKLPDAVIADFARWLKIGAPDPREGAGKTKKSVDYQEGLRFWAFQPPAPSKLPEVEKASWIKNDIDRFVLSKLEANKLPPAASADRRALIRRAYFGLIGLPPTPEEVDAFANDDSPNAFAEVVDRLLASKHYGERWGRHWLDVARYGEDQAHTFKARNYPRGYFYRDWVVKSLNDDLPYNRFLLHQIAGDLLDEPNRHERIAALGLFALGPVYYQDNGEKAKALADEWDDRVDTLMRGVLGLTAACARCHDHKYDPISTADYYALAGVFASTNYQERPIVSDDVLQQRREAEAEQKQLQLKLDRFLATEAKQVREKLVDLIPQYVEQAWIYHNKIKSVDAKKRKRVLKQVAKKAKMSEELLGRWHAYLTKKDNSTRPHLQSWAELLDAQDDKQDLSKNEAQLAKVREQAKALQQAVVALLPRKPVLFKRYGDSVAFVKPEERADVAPGVIPLGNLFDDAKGTSLSAAVASDRFGASASTKTLGVQRIAQGWGERTQIAPGVNFNFAKLGSDDRSHGSITNDAWHGEGGISTTGRRRSGKRMEQGVGMHANALITFDLDELRRAGLMPADQRFVFRSRRAGINDDTFGSTSPSAHLAVIVSKPHATKNVFDAIISGHVNGAPLTVDENDTVYYFGGDEPQPLKGDGRFVSFEVAIPAEAKYLTLVATGAGAGADGNTINSDHTVFSGAELVMDPLPKSTIAATEGESDDDIEDDARSLEEAKLLSEFFYDAGLLAVPPAAAESYFDEPTTEQLAALRSRVEQQKQAVQAIKTPQAHALSDGKGRDLKIYLQGDPKKQGELAPRAFPAIFTGGERAAFSTAGSGRLDLAKAIVDPKNPLTSRVIVNRLWRGHFGRGLVSTPSNFGQLGDRPSHPELLDYLALKLIDSGWSLKAVHREIMLSATYQQSSAYHAGNYAIDPDNRLLWRMNRRRLEVEPWRDAILSASGNLDKTMGGPPQNLDDSKNNRRTIYGFVSRHRLNELLRLFDFPDPNITSAKRSATTVPLQQLFVLNSSFMIDQARALADRLQKEVETDGERLQLAYRLLYGRGPTDTEQTVGLEFLANSSTDKQAGDNLSAWQQYCLALLGSNEFAFID